MLNIETTRRIESKLFQGVAFAVAVWLDEHRLRQRVAASEANEKLRDLQAQHEELIDPLVAEKGKEASEILRSELTPAQRASLDKISARVRLIEETEIEPTFIEVGLVNLSGVEIAGKSAGPAEVKARRVPAALYQEILLAIRREAGLEPAEVENLESPTTSGARAVGEGESTSAAPAEQKATS